MKFLRAEEGDEPTPATIRPFIQIVAFAQRAQERAQALPRPCGAGAGARRPASAAPEAPPAAGSDRHRFRRPQRHCPLPRSPRPCRHRHRLCDRQRRCPHRKSPHNRRRPSRPMQSRPTQSPHPSTQPRRTPFRSIRPRRTSPRRPAPPHRSTSSARSAPLIPSTPRIRPEMLDACVVALRRMGGPALQSVGVTSSVRGEGRSTVAAAMAVIHASEYRRRTILVELDGHKSSAAREFGLADSPGVAEFMRGDLDIEDCIQWVTDDLGVVVAGADPSMATLLRGSTAEDIVDALAEHADMLVLDLPPLEKGAGGVQLVDLCEAVALVVRAGVSTHRIEEAAAALTTPPFVILNGVKSAAPRWVRRLLGMR